MTDLHTHILPGMDDGAKTVEMSLAMLRMERDQGVDTVVLTPHFYRDRESPEKFLSRRRAAGEALRDALESLPEEERKTLPRLAVGAEVAWMPNLADWPELPRLCLGRSRNLLLELPFSPWSGQMIRQIYDLMGRTGITPVIAHIERYLKIQKAEHIAEVLALGVPVQLSAEPLLHPLRRGRALKLLRGRQVQLLASDCHNTTVRPPNLGPAAEIVKSRLGAEKLASMSRRTDALAAGPP
ncbi:MAG: hypothetical protein Q4C45_04925 [Oscillospiraceae bacterium]|nr:hypothetical protein [Oscillospiraceae bacterium]